jgi:hypothetical protein
MQLSEVKFAHLDEKYRPRVIKMLDPAGKKHGIICWKLSCRGCPFSMTADCELAIVRKKHSTLSNMEIAEEYIRQLDEKLKEQ